jgi:hypothetical protein
MSKAGEKSLTKRNALVKMCDDIQEIADVTFTNGYGTLHFPSKETCGIQVEVHNHVIEYVSVSLQHETPEGDLVDVVKKYRAD